MTAVTTRARRTASPAAPQGLTPESGPAVQATLAAARALLTAMPASPVLLDALHAALSREEALRASPLLTVDGRRANPLPLRWYGRGQPMGEAFERWAQEIRASTAGDVTVDWRALRLDRRDGALFRAGGAGLPATEHALGQLLGVVGPAYGRALPAVVSAMPAAAGVAWVQHVAAAKRGVADPVVLRLGRTATGERVVRAAVTPRHSLAAFDDAALAATLLPLVPADAEVGLVRSALGVETRGWASMRGPDKTVDLTVHWRNSETGQARLGFRGGVCIRALDAHVVGRPVEVASEDGATERNHTLPTVATVALQRAYPGLNLPSSGLLSDEHRAGIARERMRASFEGATAASEALASAWAVALTSFPGGRTSAPPRGEHHVAVVMDALEEAGLAPATELREAFVKVLTDEQRLTALPYLSAAHVAGVYAVLASRADREGVTVTWEEAERLQRIAGRWAMAGWDAKAHAALARGEV